MKTTIGITIGDPAGIGPEVILKTLSSGQLPADLEIILFSNVLVLKDQAVYLDLALDIEQKQHELDVVIAHRTFRIIDPTNWGDRMIFPGKPDSQLATGILSCLDTAVRWTLDGKIQGIVTAPLSKEVIRNGGYPDFTGHTEYLGKLTGRKHPVMMLMSPRLKVVLATTHVPFQSIPTLLNQDLLVETLQIVHDWFTTFLGCRPKIAMAAPNPHAGEGGTIGKEEKTVLLPAVTTAKEKGISVSGPYPADTIFQRSIKGEFDVVLALYHDQGMVPVKLDATCSAVNITLGLPLIRTSPDHGTAFDLAGKGQANHTSFYQALVSAFQLARSQQKH